MLGIYKQVKEECDRQDFKWGVRSQHPLVWMSILTEEIGEVSQEINNSGFDSDRLGDNYKTELVQCAAVIFQMIKDYESSRQTD